MRVALAGVALAVAVAVVARDAVVERPWVTAALAAAGALPLVLRAARPRPGRSRWIAVTSVVVVFAAVAAIVVRRPDDGTLAPMLLVVLACSLAFDLPLRVSLPVLLAALAMPQLLNLAVGAHTPIAVAIGTACAWVAGVGLRSQERLLGELRAAQAAVAERAAAEERRRITGEVHDLVAHTLAVTMLHLTGARLSLAEGDTGEALDSLGEAERTGRQAMREMRRTVGQRGAASGAGVVPALPGATDLPDLLAEYTAAGLLVALEVDGDLGGLPEATGLGLYRIVQESLANAARHAPQGAVKVAVTVVGGEVRVSISNERRGTSTMPGGGLGIAGMARRAALLGGTFTAGPSGRDWQVEAVLPMATA
jgi:signal transduction histidine kinase